VVDGQENTPSNIYTQKFHEVQKYTTNSDHGYIGYVVIVNKKFWDGLPADIRQNLDKAMDEATKYANEISETENSDAWNDIKKSGKTEIIQLTAAQKAAWKKALTPVYKDAEGRVGKSLIEEFEKATQATGTN
jgi:C4-dicarboxylate-binding protein DctP